MEQNQEQPIVEVVAKCKATVTSYLSKKVSKFDIEIARADNQELKAHVIYSIDDFAGPFTDSVTFNEYQIREDLLSSSRNASNLNDGEKSVIQADRLTTDPSFNGHYKTGIDLTQVRSIKQFLIGEKTVSGSTLVVQAFDSNNRPLGSFLGGHLLSPCD
jgi:hypothetical protein